MEEEGKQEERKRREGGGGRYGCNFNLIGKNNREEKGGKNEDDNLVLFSLIFEIFERV